MSWVASLTLEAKGNRDPFVTQHLGAPPPTDPPFFSGTRSLFPTSCESPPPVVTFQLQFESFGISPTPVFEFGVSKSPNPVFEFGVSLFQEQSQRSDHWQVCAKAGRDNNTNVLCKSDHGPQPGHILTGAVVRLNQYVSPHRPRIAYSQRGPAPVLGFQIKTETFQRCLYLSVSLTNCPCSLLILIESE